MSRTVAVIGGGYGGAAVAKALESEADVILIDPREAFVNAAASLRALARPDWAANAFFPFETLLTKGAVIRDRAVSVDLGGVTLASGERVAADYLVLATGSSYAYPAKPGSDSIGAALDDLRRTHKELRQADNLPFPVIILPLGSKGGVGQLPSPEGPSVASASVVAEYKGTDLFTARFVEQFGPTA
ncbi:FAD-dependent oxidoreductase [Actinoallomurus sp. NPDC052274]|uniref:FAD-dependent oxidoreductase n=1 Tax=Actinoallomurus sp. NPDC052274 TaxID=3155420 RepID=UPI00342634CD